MAAEPGTRFAHLLQPIKDLSRVWKIEIADELEKYIEEVSQLIVTNPEAGIGQLNFAEAALLIQGSTAIYSRKVELLYQLVYQALDLLAEKKDGAPGRKGAKAVQSGLWAPIPETEELLTIDHLIKQGRNITLDPDAVPVHEQAVQRRMPLFLMPRDQQDRRKKEFRISACTVHHSGVFLLQESDAKLLDDLICAAPAVPASGGDAPPLVPAPPKEMQDLEDRLNELHREMAEEPAPCNDAIVEMGEVTPGADGKNMPAGSAAADARANLGERFAAVASRMPPGFVAASDPWAPLDEHETVGKDVPLEVGRTSRRVTASNRLLAKAEGVPEHNNALPSDASLWAFDDPSSCSGLPALAAGHPVEALFQAVAGRLGGCVRQEVQKAGFSPVWLEFEDLFAAAAAKRRSMKCHFRGTPGPAARAGEDEAADRDDALGEEIVDAAAPVPEAGELDANQIVPPELSAEMVRHDEQLREVAALENMIQEAQNKYEATIRQHLQRIQHDGADDDQRKFPQLYANVKRWQEQLAPVLKEFESRPEFDIHYYSTQLLSRLKDTGEHDGEDVIVPFAAIVEGQPRYEVCRRFLTCLLLTNQGNTDILFNGEEERLNGFRIKLLKAEKLMVKLDGNDKENVAAVPVGKRSRRASKLDAAGAPGVLDDAAAPAREPLGALGGLAQKKRRRAR